MVYEEECWATVGEERWSKRKSEESVRKKEVSCRVWREGTAAGDMGEVFHHDATTSGMDRLPAPHVIIISMARLLDPPVTIIRMARLHDSPLTIIIIPVGLIQPGITKQMSGYPAIIRNPLWIEAREYPLVIQQTK